MFEDIRKNKIKTDIIIFIFTVMVTLIIYFICHALDLGEFAIFIALAFSIISAFSTYYNCDKIVLASVNARKATKEEDLKLTNILESLVLAAGLEHTPELYVVNSSQPNAFATRKES